MWRKASLFAVLILGIVLSTCIWDKEGPADQRRDQDGRPTLRISDAPPSHAPRRPQRLGFRSPDRQHEPPVIAVSTKAACRPAVALASDEVPDASDARTKLPATPQDAIQPKERTHPLNELRPAQSTASDRGGTAIGPNQQTVNLGRAAGPSATSRPATLTLSDGGPTASKLRRGHGAKPTREAESAGRSAKVHLDDELQPRESERPIAATTPFGSKEEGVKLPKIGSSSRRTPHLRTNETQGAKRAGDRARPSNRLRAAQPPVINRIGAAVGADKQRVNPLRAVGSPAALRRPMLTVTDGEPVASKSQPEQSAERISEGESAGGPAKVLPGNRLQSRESAHRVTAAAPDHDIEEPIPVFKIGTSSRRTVHRWTNKANPADGSDAADRKAPDGTRDETRAASENAICDKPAEARSSSKTGGKTTPKVVVSGPTVRNQKAAARSAAVGASKITLSGSLPPVTNPLRIPVRKEKYLRSYFALPQSPPRTDQVTERVTADKGRVSHHDAPLQPQSTIVSRLGTIPSPSLPNAQRIALAGTVIPSSLGQPCPRRETSLPRATVPTGKERTSRRVPRATLPNKLPLAPSVAPVNALRTRSAVASVSKQPRITAPKPLPRNEPQIEIKPLPVSRPTLRLAVRESRMFRSPENIVRVASASAEVCDVVQLSARDVAVVGRSAGTTRIDFWYDNRGVSPVSHVVAVGPDGTVETPNDGRNQEVRKLISYLFPASHVELISKEGCLVVRGRTVSRRRAIDILSTIRRSQLVPVVDELVVQDD